MQEGTNRVLEQYPSAEVVVLGDFNAHHQEWLGSRTTDLPGRTAYDFALAYGFSQLVTQPTRVPDIEGHEPSLLDLLLTTDPAGYSVVVDAPLGSSDHCLIRAAVTLSRPGRRTTTGYSIDWRYMSAD
ncbi:hypothetical protein FEG32_18870, partial [Acinetobacter baumannii]